MEPPGILTGLKIRPIVVGIVVDYVATYVAMFAWITLYLSRRFSGQSELSDEAIQNYLASTEGLLNGFAIGTLCTVLGGCVAARQAKTLEIKHGAFVGVGSLLLSALEQGISGSGASLPQWYVLMSALAIVPAGALGGYVAEHWNRVSLGRR